jgi:hypothetical protein
MRFSSDSMTPSTSASSGGFTSGRPQSSAWKSSRCFNHVLAQLQKLTLDRLLPSVSLHTGLEYSRATG